MINGDARPGTGPLWALMGELSRILTEAEAAQAREPDPFRREAIGRLIRDLESRIAPVSAEFARLCLRLLEPDPEIARIRTEQESDLPLMGMRFAAALQETDPRVHGEARALSALRAALLAWDRGTRER